MGYQMKSYKKFVATAATATLVASAIVPVASASFTDVEETHEFATYINAAVEAGYVKGYEDGTFGINDKLKRSHVVLIIGRYLEKLGYTSEATTSPWSDVTSEEVIKYGNIVKDAGVFKGFADGTLKGNDFITRENMAVVLDRVAKTVTGTSLSEVAADIENVEIADLATANADYQASIQALRDLEISTAKNFNPKGDVKRGQFAKFIVTTVETIDSIEVAPEVTAEDIKKEIEAVDATLPAVKDITADNAETAKVAVEAAKTAIAAIKEKIQVTGLTGEEVAELNKAIEAVEAKFELIVEAADKAIEAAKEFTVESVTAINGSTIQVKFTKAVKKSTVIESDDTLVNGVFKYVVDATGSKDVPLNTQKGELSEDGKTLTIYNGVKLEGNYVLTVAKDVVLTADGSKALPESKVKFNIKDTTRAAVESVTNESKYVFNINLTEPVNSTGTVTATLADGTSVIASQAQLINNNKTIQVTLVNNNTAVNAGKDVTVTIPALTDYAGNISVPTTQTVKVSNADVTAPTVASVVATSAKTIELTFDEAVTVDATKFKFNGSNGTIDNIAPKAEDTTKTKFVVTLKADQTTAAYLELLAGAATDLSGNALEATSKLVVFNTDKTAPTIVSNSVQKIGGVNYLVLNFSEKVELGVTTALSFKYKDEFGVEQSTTLAADKIQTDITANGADGKSFKIELTNIKKPELKTGVEYTVEFAKGYFKDAFSNDLEKTAVKFVNNASENTTTTKLVATIGAEGVDADGRFITVNFDKTVDPTSAQEKSNYTVEGATVKEVKLATNTATGGSVKVYLTADTVKLTGNYQVTVKNVKGFNASITAMDETTKTVVITENVAAKVKSHSITFGKNTVINLTFDENVKVTTGTDFDLYIDDVKSTATVAVAQNGNAGVKVTVTGLDLSADIASAKKVVLKANSSFDITDANDNVASTVDVTLN